MHDDKGPGSGHPFTPVDLKGLYTLNGTASANSPGDGTLDGQFGFPAEELPPAGSAILLDADFDLPDGTDGEKNFLIPDGQRVPVPAGEYATLFVLGTSVLGGSGMELGLEFDDGGTPREEKEIVRFTDWCHAPQQGEETAIRATRRYNGVDPVEQDCSIWMQPIFLPPGRRLAAITFNYSPNLRILAATLGRERYAPPEASLLRYLFVRLAARNRAAAVVSSLYETLADIADLRDDGELAERLGTVRRALLDTLGVDDLFGGDEARVTGAFLGVRPRLEEIEARARQKLAAETDTGPLEVTLVGHSHLDAVWLWPWNETVGKAHRTFRLNLERLEKYEGVTFAQSSPLFYEWIERDRPDLFDRVRKQVAAGRWELVGGMWVEPDGNMPCGESLVRQRLLGQRYFLDRFGRLSEVAWIPDTFGMHANHPQIIRKTGGRYFFTTKLMWSYENEFPYQHFLWESPDGSRVLALQSPVGCGAEPGPHDRIEDSVRSRNTLLRPGEQVRVGAGAPHVPDEARSEEFVPDVLCIYGEGDGGEGPSERLYQRASTLSMLPGYRHGTVHEHFRRVDARYRDRLPVWSDELYLENHRGTTTSQGRIKDLNRKGEALLLAAEKWSVMAEALAQGGTWGEELGGNREDLAGAWRKLLFNQFHDILPGTSIPQAYVDAELDFDALLHSGERVRRNALRTIASRIDTVPARGEGGAAVETGRSVPDFLIIYSDPDELPGDGEPALSTGRALILFNPLSWERTETVDIPFGFAGVSVLDRENRPIPSQVVFRDGENRLLFHIAIPAFGYTQVRLLAGRTPPEPARPVTIGGRTIENRFYRITLTPEGDIAELLDKESGRDILPGGGNRIRFYRNRPFEWSNWNIDPDYESHELDPAENGNGDAAPVSIEIVDRGPVTASFRITSAGAAGGRVVREIRLHADDRRIDLVTDVEVAYRESLVKADFPFDLGGAESVTTEIAYGTYTRPTRPSTPFEKAKWEVWTQKWLDISGPAGGVTIVNRSRYGFDVKGDRIRLTLVKGGIMPDPATDVGTHRIACALYPHGGGFRDAHAWRRGYEFNYPATPLLEEEHRGSLPACGSLASLSAPNVCWETLKAEEDGPGLVIRVYEVEGRDTSGVTLTLPFDLERAEEIDFLELNVLKPLAAEGPRVRFDIGHDEIKAIRIYRKEGAGHADP